MISHTMPESPCTDTKIIPDFAFVSSYRRTVIFRLFQLRSETALRHRRSLKVDRHISRDRFLPLFVAVWTGFQVKWVGASMGWDPLIWKYIFRREDCDLVHQTVKMKTTVSVYGYSFLVLRTVQLQLLIFLSVKYSPILSYWSPTPSPRDPYNNLKKKRMLWQKLNHRDPTEITASFQEY